MYTRKNIPVALKPTQEQMSQNTLLCIALSKAELENSDHRVASPPKLHDGNGAASREKWTGS